MKAFTTTTISDINSLYGRTELIELLEQMCTRENVPIYGCRRFGKSSLLKTFDSYARCKQLPVYPVYIEVDASLLGDGSNSHFYSSLIIILLRRLSSDGLSACVEKVDGVRLNIDDKNLRSKLMRLNVASINSLWKNVIIQTSMKLRKTVLFMFDEYESLLSPNSKDLDLMPFHSLSSDSGVNDIKPFSFFI